MKSFSYRGFFRIAILALIVVISAASSFAQAAPGSMHGTVTDPSGAAVTKADVQITAPDGKVLNATTNNTGGYEIKGLA
ncbi:MAG TPA: carboxypeptidase-like regulatory domain-containing protein, partial [Terriglobales bacterium]